MLIDSIRNMKIPIFGIFLRSLFLQSMWNYERMQNVGFVFSIVPWLKHLYKKIDEEHFCNRVRYHLGFFNTHPYMANIIIGIIMKLEEKYLNNEINEEEIGRTKTMLAGPLAAIGDRLIWSTWRVFCGIIAVCYFILFGKNFYINANFVVGILLFVLLYNLIGHLPIRILGIYWGYHYSKEIVDKLAKFGLQKIVSVVRTTGIILLCISSFIYSISAVDNIQLVILFWFNIMAAMILSKKIDAIFIFLLLLTVNIIILFIIPK